jgi:probable HAF family extracellular repeat protein
MGIFFPFAKMFHRSRGKRPPSTRRLLVEALEDRLCPSYATIDLGTLGGAFSEARAVNESGQVVGSASTAAGDQHAFLWQNGTMTDLGTLGGPKSFANDINDAGQIVGGSWLSSTPLSHAVLWQNGVMTDLGTLGGEGSGTMAINNQGQIVGLAQTADGVFHDYVYENGVMYDLDALLPANSGWVTQFYGLDINDNGQIAGMGLFNGVQHPFLISDPDGIFANGGATITNLGVFSAEGINDLGQVTGSVASPLGNHACLYSGGVLKDIKTLGGPYSSANAVNDKTQIVGRSLTKPGAYDDDNHAFLWQNGKMTDLNKFRSPRSAGTLDTATDINNVGQIVGQIRFGTIWSGYYHAFLMVPGAALEAQSVATEAATDTIGMGQVQSLLGEAIARWQAAGVDTSGLGNLQVHIANLGGTTLGLASGNTIWLDDNAAGWGWFVDPTPGDDFEFTTTGNQGEQHRMDLLTVLEHELGHMLGFDHQETGIMEDTLTTGTRRTPSSDSGLVDLAMQDKVFDGGWTSHSDPFIDGSVFDALVVLQKQRKAGMGAP